MWNATTTKTVPTIGRKVWFWPHEGIFAFVNVSIKDSGQPFDATVVFVNHERSTVNLLIVDHSGEIHNAWDVPLFDPLSPDKIQSQLENLVDMESEDNRWGIATWMPYQAAQHASQAEKQQAVNVPQAVSTSIIGASESVILTDGKDV